MKFFLRISRCIYEKYMWFLLLNGIILVLIRQLAVFEYLLFPIVGYILFFFYKSKIKNLFDILVFISFLWIFLTWIINTGEFSYMLVLRCILSQIAFMVFYYVGRNCEIDYTVLLKNAIIPLAICSIVGIYWFVNPPAWYIAKALNSDSYTGTETTYLELMRLRSFFPSPYEMSYMLFFVSSYLINDIVVNNNRKIKNYLFLMLFLITMLLCMMRAPIALILIVGLFYIFHGLIYGHVKISHVLFSLLLIIILCYIISVFLNKQDQSMIEYLDRKTEQVSEDSQGFLLSRVSSTEWTIDVWGDGAGKHSIYAEKYGEKSIRDAEYLKILVEQGWIGLSIFVILLICALIKTIRNIRYLSLEFLILIFYIVTMLGADSITTADKHCFFFWLVVGKVASFNKNKHIYIV